VLSKNLWKRISPENFEFLALQHVGDLYPEYAWRHTRKSGDGGADGHGVLADGIDELYWMEAKHHPGSNLGKYTLDTHLMSAFFTRGRVKRLHIVTSGRLSLPFLSRADEFARDHGFEFAFTDQHPLEAWLQRRSEFVAQYFGEHADEAMAALREIEGAAGGEEIFCSAAVFPHDDSLLPHPVPAADLVPGRKYLLALAFSTARRIPPERLPLHVRWSPDPAFVSPLSREFTQSGELSIERISARSVLTIPFRLLRTGRELPSVHVYDAADEAVLDVPLPRLRDVVALTAPFVGDTAQKQLIQTRRILVEDVAYGRARLLALTGRAGSGKSRLAQELRDDAQRRGFLVKKLEFSTDPGAQHAQWILLLRWIFGLEHNAFELDEARLLDAAVDALGDPSGGGEASADLKAKLKALLVGRAWDESLFNLEIPTGRLMAEAVGRALARRLAAPLLLHLEDGHHLTGPRMGPLFLLRHIIEAADALPLAVVVAARDDETVAQGAMRHFVRAVEMAGGERGSHWRVPDLSHSDARALVWGVLRIPELRSRDWRTTDRLIQRAGTNPFALMQTLHYLVFDRGAIGFSYADHSYFADLEALKEALRSMPARIEDLLTARFRGLVRRGEGHLLELLAAAAVWGKEVPVKVLRGTATSPITPADLQKLLSLGYFAQADRQRVVLAHDLLQEALLARREKAAAARRIAKFLDGNAGVRVDEGRRAAICFHAGPRFHGQSWDFAGRAVQVARGSEDHLRALEPLGLMEELARAHPRRFTLTPAIRFAAAITHQHCGNTARALEMFLSLREEAARTLASDPEAPRRYVESTIEACNQYFLRAMPAEAVRYADDALAALDDPAIQLLDGSAGSMRALAHDRRGAALHLADRKEEAAASYQAALAAADEADDAYMRSHTLSDFASLLRFRDPARSGELLRGARETWRQRLRGMERRRIMLDVQEVYDACMRANTPLARARLHGFAAEAAEKGYLYQSAGALLCLACASLMDGRTEEAMDALLQVLDLTTLTEDYRARIFAFHYAAVCAHARGDAAMALHWNDQALRLMEDPLFSGSALRECLVHNEQVMRGGRAVAPDFPERWRTDGLSWYRYDRS
jgi:tetratricopeptide (TPR) repeat protein